MYTQVCNLDSSVHVFYTRLDLEKPVYDIGHVQRIVAYTARHRKSIPRAKIKVFSRILMFDGDFMDRLKHGVGLEGEGT